MAATDATAESIDRPLVEPGVLEQRSYQTKLADAAAADHTLVCLPTGLGKTAVSLLVTAERLHEVGGKSLLLAPTKPLVQQHADFYREALTIDDEEIVVFTGEVRPDDRAELWESATVVVATPQVVENDLLGSRIDLSPVTHCTFDECHRASGEYPYTYIAERYHEESVDPLVTGMSASPGDDEEAILQVCDNLGIREVEVMTSEDADVEAYTHNTSVNWERVELPEPVVEIRDALQDVIHDRMTQLKELGVTSSTQADVSEREIRKIQAKLRELMDNDQSEGYQGMSLLAEVRKLRTAVTYAETQSVESLRRYLERLREAARSSGASKADQRLISAPKVREARRKAEDFDDLHPKFRRTRMQIAETLGIHDGERVIVFTESRDTAETLTDFLAEHFTVEKFVGQSDTDGSDGMTQTEQQETLEAFRAGEFEVLVSTSVAEEGLDVPEVDLVLFYEPVPTAIRSIQRKGRTGRQTEGAVVVLIAEDTRDEAYFWKARQDEKRMEEELRTLKEMAGDIESHLREQMGLEGYEETSPESDDTTAGSNAVEAVETTDDPADADDDDEQTVQGAADGGEGDGQTGLDAFAASDDGVTESPTGEADDQPDQDEETTVATADGEDTIEVVIDQRELDASIGRDLSRRDGFETRLETLEVGDYVLSDRVVVERKTISDFLDTLTGGDRSMFEQVKDDARYYDRPVVILEGDGLYEERNVHPNAIRGALASLAVDFGASVLRTDDESGTADLLATIATREQETDDREISVHGEKGSKTLPEQQEYVVASIADVGPVTAQALLEHFGSVEAVMTAGEADLLDVEGVGAVTAERIREVVGSEYQP
ncbi:ATP-dependent RNA helicase protein [Halorhabdus tiamatea SARL4B]|uniref:ATP-dependent RNA helicase protein n=1 Tax=Halorhabdus tiamatea SARL4B TaxID=1033806 RepID=F7PNT5_9EURY|nr:DEAD/DEAH box helicase [Halorhabdus tiamatea]ERJ06756.1 ATP-dependent RNA helicase protein [Halorhabdus tiamatea SARL4B]CCQ33679.1 ATP-dependent RNA helicase/nuclease Hef [Halorhabdus tiamatea SARL4B]